MRPLLLTLPFLSSKPATAFLGVRSGTIQKRKTIRPSPRSSVNDEQRLTRVNQRAVSIIFKLFGAIIVAVGVDKAKAGPEITILIDQTTGFAKLLKNKELLASVGRRGFVDQPRFALSVINCARFLLHLSKYSCVGI